MTRAERILYHQVHPLKLLTDVSSSFATTWLLWEARWLLAALVAFTPSIVVTIALVTWADLERCRDYALGRYVSGFMTRRIEAFRFAGQLIAWGGAAGHVPWLVPTGYVIVLLAWLSGLWRRPKGS